MQTVYKQITNVMFCKKVGANQKYATNLTGRQDQTSRPNRRLSKIYIYQAVKQKEQSKLKRQKTGL